MLMPGRYLSDTSARCQTITQTRFFTTYVDSCWTVPGWIHWNPWVIRIGSATVTPAGTAIQAVLPDPSSMVYISRTAVPSAINHVSLLLESVSNPVVISVVETVDGQEVVLGEQLLQSAQMSTVSFSITPSTPSIRIRVRWFTAPAIMRWRTICVQVPQMQSETYLVDVCDEIGDRFRFGYNGIEKTNEIAGIGNHYTALFGEYDTRIVGRWNTDPKSITRESSYVMFRNNPICYSDYNLDYSRIGAWWRNKLNGGKGTNYSKFTQEWGYQKSIDNGVAYKDGLSSNERSERIGKFKSTHIKSQNSDEWYNMNVNSGYIKKFEPDFLDKWSKSENVASGYSYGFVNSFYVTIQNFTTKTFRKDDYSFNLDGSISSTNNNINTFTDVATSFIPITKLKYGLGAISKINAAQYSKLFKGTAFSRMKPKNRGRVNKSINYGVSKWNEEISTGKIIMGQSGSLESNDSKEE